MSIWYRRIISLLLAYFVQRLLFIGFNFKALAAIDGLRLVSAFFDGLRFDLCIIATVNIPLFAIHALRGLPMLSRHPKWLDHAVSLLFVLTNVPLIVFGVVDSHLVSFTGRRISPAIFEIGGDIRDQSIGIMLQFWWITIPTVALILIFAWYTWQKDHSRSTYNWSFLQNTWPKSAGFVLIGLLLIRGGWQTKPLAPAHAFNWQPTVLANMVLNSGMTVLRTPKSVAVKRYDDFQDVNEIRRTLNPRLEGRTPSGIARGKNVVILIVESLATEYVGFLNHGKGYTPFIDELSKKSIYFEHSYANGRRSIDAMPAIFSGVPAWRDQPFVTSPYAANETVPLPKTLHELGYATLFFHGAANGSMHFDVFSRIAGFEKYIGENEYPNGNDHDGQWGIFDEPFLKFAVEELNAAKAPFFAGIFTLTSHNPFKIPEKYSGRFPTGSLPIHQAIGYADFSLSEFFKAAQSQPWFLDTIFVITGDHTSLSDNPEFDSMPGRFRVPIIFYDPTNSLPKISPQKVASHIDIKPTIMDLLGVDPSKFGPFGGPLFANDWPGRTIQSEWDTWYYRDGNVQLTIDPSNRASVFSIIDTRLKTAEMPTPAFDQQIMTLKAARQYFSNGLLDNNWYPTASNQVGIRH
jgi:phosphoglycerol transferase MdoB-like AlkP superfamily enzyme